MKNLVVLLEILNGKMSVKGNLVTWCKLVFGACRKRDSKSL